MFRLRDDRALLNRMGFNNHGAGELALPAQAQTPVGLSAVVELHAELTLSLS